MGWFRRDSLLTWTLLAASCVAPAHAALAPRFETAKLVADDANTRNKFGWAVALSPGGETAAIGAPLRDELYVDAAGRLLVRYFDSGGVYIHRFDGGAWSQQALLLADDAGNFDGFGRAVGLSDDRVIVGAPGSDHRYPAEGAYIFRRAGDGWVQEAKLVPPAGDTGSEFGTAVAISGTTAVVGVPGSAQGAAYVYVFDGIDWTLAARLVASDGAPNDHFGRSVSVSGDVVIVGAFRHEEGDIQTGAVYVFRFDGSGWSEEAKLLASDATSSLRFGSAVAIDGETILAGAPSLNEASRAVYVYRHDGSAWYEEAKLQTVGARSGGFGHSVAISGGTVATGAPNGDTGTVYVFQLEAAGWTEKPPRIPSDGEWYDGLGIAVAVSGQRVLSGASSHATVGSESGAAYVFDLRAVPIPESAPFVPIPGLPGERDTSSAHAISADGSTLVGSSDTTLQGNPLGEAFRWTRSEGTERLDAPNGFATFHEARGVSAQGLTAVGRGRGGLGERALVWPAGGEPDSILASSRMVANAVSADGSVIVGSRDLSSSIELAFLHTPFPYRMLGLGFLPGGSTLSVATDVSDDGTIVIGYSQSTNAPSSEFEAFLWTEADGMLGLGALPGGDGASRAQDVSPGGRFVVGASSTPAGRFEAFLWSEAEGMIGLCDPPACERGVDVSEAFGVSDDGAVAVGSLTRHGGEFILSRDAFYWTAADGMRLMSDVVEQDFGVDLTDWLLMSAVGVSADGHAIAGNALDADGNPRAWLMVTRLSVDLLIDPFRDPNFVRFAGRRPLPVAVLGSEAFDVARADPATLVFGPAGATGVQEKRRVPEDVNSDGRPDLLLSYDVGETGIAVGDTRACLVGRTLDGMPFAGCDSVVTEHACGLGYELVLLLPPLAWMRRRKSTRSAARA